MHTINKHVAATTRILDCLAVIAVPSKPFRLLLPLLVLLAAAAEAIAAMTRIQKFLLLPETEEQDKAAEPQAVMVGSIAMRQGHATP